MLNIEEFDDVNHQLASMLNTFSIGHVSRYPINVEFSNPSYALFVDSRFPLIKGRHDEAIATLNVGVKDGKTLYTLRSERIENEKYRPHSDGYHTRSVTNAKKMLRLLKEIVTPLEPFEIARRSSGDDIKYDASRWCSEPRDKLVELVGGVVIMRELLDEVLYLQSTGVQFRSDKFKKVAMEGRELQLEAIRRQKAISRADSLTLYVHEQPDGAVIVVMDGRINDSDSKSWTYENVGSLPEDIQQKMALLNLCDVDKYVPEVGKRDTQKGYWVHVAREKFTLPTP